MFYKSSDRLVEKLLVLPESGMGYQIVNTKTPTINKRYVFLNGIFGFDIGVSANFRYKEATTIDLDIDISNLVLSGSVGAIDSAVENASGSDTQKFVRLSAFENDFRVDRETGRLLPGSFTTDFEDFMTMTFPINDYDPLDYYSLPNSLPIKWLFYFRSIHGDTFQRGIVQPAFGKNGGGKEYFFEHGTSKNSLISAASF